MMIGKKKFAYQDTHTISHHPKTFHALQRRNKIENFVVDFHEGLLKEVWLESV